MSDRETHRFYFLPVASFGMLSSPGYIDFWLGESDHRMLKIVAIEDGEGLLMERGSDNRESLATLLNCADGLLGDSLKLRGFRIPTGWPLWRGGGADVVFPFVSRGIPHRAIGKPIRIPCCYPNPPLR